MEVKNNVNNTSTTTLETGNIPHPNFSHSDITQGREVLNRLFAVKNNEKFNDTGALSAVSDISVPKETSLEKEDEIVTNILDAVDEPFIEESSTENIGNLRSLDYIIDNQSEIQLDYEMLAARIQSRNQVIGEFMVGTNEIIENNSNQVQEVHLENINLAEDFERINSQLTRQLI